MSRLHVTGSTRLAAEMPVLVAEYPRHAVTPRVLVAVFTTFSTHTQTYTTLPYAVTMFQLTM